ncbi:MAG: alpha/beta fold hydrolase [Rudaea sp.]
MSPRRTLALALGIAGAAYSRHAARQFQRDLRAARARVAEAARIADTASGPIEYATVGDGPAVLVVHGAGGGVDQGLDFGGVLALAGFRVIAMSRFGYLGTPLPLDASPQAQADAHAHLLDALGIERAAIAGASAGAPSSLQFALRHRARCTALILLVPAAYVPRPAGQPPVLAPAVTQFLFDTALRSDFLFWVATKTMRRALIRGLLATPPSLVARASADERARVDAIIEHILPVSARRLGLQNDARVVGALPRYDLESIDVPTLIAGVEDDLYGTYDAAHYMARHIGHARFIGYPHGGHVWVGHHRGLMAEVVAFLRRATEPS